jgi:hypothetical protein
MPTDPEFKSYKQLFKLDCGKLFEQSKVLMVNYLADDC